MYWSLVALPMLASLVARPKTVGTLFALLVVTFVVIAFRQSGGDYYTYNLLFRLTSSWDLSRAMTFTDPGYGFLNWLSAQMGWGLYGVNAICAAMFLTGFYFFARREPQPVLALAVAMPYLIIVVVVGYTRQGTAIGFEFLALLNLMQRRPLRFVLWILVAMLFHSSAAVLLPLTYFALPARTGLLGKAFASAAVLVLVWTVYNQMDDRIQAFYTTYVESDHYQSQGALVRSLMSAAAAVCFLVYRKRWSRTWTDGDIVAALSLTALAMVPLTFVSSTAADRIGLYLLPLQVIVFGRMPSLWGTANLRMTMQLGIMTIYILTFYVWLHLGQFARILWLPYSSPLFGQFY